MDPIIVNIRRQYKFEISVNHYLDLLMALNNLDPFNDRQNGPMRAKIAMSVHNGNGVQVTLLMDESNIEKEEIARIATLLTVVFDVHYISKNVIVVSNIPNSTKLMHIISCIDANTKVNTIYYTTSGDLVIDSADNNVASVAATHYEGLIDGQHVLGLENPKYVK